MTLLVLFWLIMATTVAAVAMHKGRSWFGFFVYGLLIWPIALIHALIITPVKEAAGAAGSDTRACPHCAETIKREAKVCKHCGRDVEPLPSAELIA